MSRLSTCSNWLDVSAPGKLMICGEYAVLEGAISVVAAVGARAVARWSTRSVDGSTSGSAGSRQSSALPPEAVLARRLAEERVGFVQADMGIDVSALRREGKKLGLGSSSAASVAAVGAVFARAGHDLDDSAVKRSIFEVALQGHRAVAPEGSGADVAAASLGGFVSVRRDAQGLPRAASCAWPKELATRVVWTGCEARTSDFIRAVRAYALHDPRGYSEQMDLMGATAQVFEQALESDDASAAVMAAGEYGERMAVLGQAVGLPIVTPELARVAQLARESGGDAKPSGAGGGDVAIAFFSSEWAATKFERSLETAGLTHLELHLGAQGVRVEAAA